MDIKSARSTVSLAKNEIKERIDRVTQEVNGGSKTNIMSLTPAALNQLSHKNTRDFRLEHFYDSFNRPESHSNTLGPNMMHVNVTTSPSRGGKGTCEVNIDYNPTGGQGISALDAIRRELGSMTSRGRREQIKECILERSTSPRQSAKGEGDSKHTVVSISSIPNSSDEVKRLRMERDELSRLLSAANQRFAAELGASIHATETEKNRREAIEHELSNREISHEGEVRALRKKLDQLEITLSSDISIVRSECENLLRELEVARCVERELVSQLRHVEENSIDQQRALEESLKREAALRQGGDAAVARLSQIVDETRAETTEIKRKLVDSENDRSLLRSQVTSLEAEMVSLSVEAEKEKSTTLMNAEAEWLSRIESENQNSKVLHDQEKRKITAMMEEKEQDWSAEKANLEADITAWKKEKEYMIFEMETKENLIGSLKEEVTSETSKVARLCVKLKEFETEHSEAMERVQGDLEKAVQSIKNVQEAGNSQVEGLNNEINELKSEIDNLNNQITVLKASLVECERDANESRDRVEIVSRTAERERKETADTLSSLRLRTAAAIDAARLEEVKRFEARMVAFERSKETEYSRLLSEQDSLKQVQNENERKELRAIIDNLRDEIRTLSLALTEAVREAESERHTANEEISRLDNKLNFLKNAEEELQHYKSISIERESLLTQLEDSIPAAIRAAEDRVKQQMMNEHSVALEAVRNLAADEISRVTHQLSLKIAASSSWNDSVTVKHKQSNVNEVLKDSELSASNINVNLNNLHSKKSISVDVIDNKLFSSPKSPPTIRSVLSVNHLGSNPKLSSSNFHPQQGLTPTTTIDFHHLEEPPYLSGANAHLPFTSGPASPHTKNIKFSALASPSRLLATAPMSPSPPHFSPPPASTRSPLSQAPPPASVLANSHLLTSQHTNALSVSPTRRRYIPPTDFLINAPRDVNSTAQYPLSSLLPLSSTYWARPSTAPIGASVKSLLTTYLPPSSALAQNLNHAGGNAYNLETTGRESGRWASNLNHSSVLSPTRLDVDSNVIVDVFLKTNSRAVSSTLTESQQQQNYRPTTTGASNYLSQVNNHQSSATMLLEGSSQIHHPSFGKAPSTTVSVSPVRNATNMIELHQSQQQKGSSSSLVTADEARKAAFDRIAGEAETAARAASIALENYRYQVERDLKNAPSANVITLQQSQKQNNGK